MNGNLHTVSFKSGVNLVLCVLLGEKGWLTGSFLAHHAKAQAFLVLIWWEVWRNTFLLLVNHHLLLLVRRSIVDAVLNVAENGRWWLNHSAALFRYALRAIVVEVVTPGGQLHA